MDLKIKTITTTAERKFYDTSDCNVDLLNDMIDHLKKRPQDLNTNDWGLQGAIYQAPDEDIMCQTPCCLAGLAAILSDQVVTPDQHKVKVLSELLKEIAQREMGISEMIAEELFDASWPKAWLEDTTRYGQLHKKPQNAIAILRMIRDGKLPLLPQLQ